MQSRFLLPMLTGTTIFGSVVDENALAPDDPATREGVDKGDPFPATRWTMLLDAGSADEDTRFSALSEFCQIYWFPLYAYLRRKGHNQDDAQDLTQGFFGRFVQRGKLGELSSLKGRGKLRAYLLSSIKNFAHDERRYQAREKRGGGVPDLSIDGSIAEARYLQGFSHEDSPESEFEKRWALDILKRCFDKLQEQYARRNKSHIYDALQPGLERAGGDVSFAEVAKQLGATIGSIRVMTHRMRQEYRGLLRDEIALTVAEDSEVDEELRYLLQILVR